MAQTAPTFHGINMAGDSYIENMAIESVLVNPTVTTGGKMWMLGTTGQAMKFSYVDGVGAVQTSTFGTAEAIADEETARISADGTLTTDLATETTARTNADTTLTTNLATEVSTRVSEDVLLQTQISNILSNTDAAALDSLTEIVTAFQLADSNLNNAITTIASDHDNELAAETLARTNADSAIQSELDATQVGAGLTAAGAASFTTFAAVSMAVDFTTTTSLFQAIEQLNNELKIGGSDAIDAEETARIAGDTALQSNLDTEESARISADNTLQTNINTEATTRATEDAAIQTELDATQTGLGVSIADDGTYVKDDSLATPVTTYLQDNLTLTEDIRDLDAVLKLTADALDAVELLATGSTQDIQDELDAVESAAGLSTAGAYVVDGTATYISEATTLSNADSLLDDQIKVNTDGISSEASSRSSADSDIQSELDATQTGLGVSLAADGTYVKDDSLLTPVTTYLQDNLSVTEDIRDLDVIAKANADAVAAETTARTNADSAIQSELDATQTGTGLASTGAYVVPTTTTYLNATSSVANAIATLDTALNNYATAATTTDTALQSELDDTQTGAGLSTAGAYVVDGTATYISTATTLSNADSLLDDQIKVNTDGLSSEVSARTTAVSDEASTRSTNDNSIVTQINSSRFAVSSIAAMSHIITHNLASDNIIVQVWVDQGDGSYANDIVPIAIDSNNQYTIYLSESRAIRTSAMKMDDISL